MHSVRSCILPSTTMPDPVTDEHVISVEELDSLCRSDAPPILINTLPAAAHRAKHIPGSINVRDFEGGYAAWRRAGHPLVGDNA